MLLASAGLDVLALDRTGEGTDTTSTHALLRGAVLQLTRWRLLPALVDAGTPAIRTSTYVYDGVRRPIAIKSAYDVHALYAPRRTLLDQVLVDAARDAGAEVRHDAVVVGLTFDGGRVNGVRYRVATGEAHARARLVIGADGINSMVARNVRADTERRASRTSAITYGYWADISTSGYEWVFHQQGCSGVIPTNDGHVCVFAAAPPEQIGRGGIDVIRRIAAIGDPELAERLDRGRPPTATRTWPGVPGHMRRAFGPGWALVGDAGYFRDPITAHGLTDALRDAELLARAVLAGIHSDDQTLNDALADYQATRDALSTQLFEVSSRLATYDWSVDELDHLLRSISSATSAEVEHLAALQPLLPEGSYQ